MLEDVSRMLDRSSASLLPPLDEAMASGFVVAAEHQLAFRSDFLLRGVMASIPAPVRGALRREAMGHPDGDKPAPGRRFRMVDPPAENNPWTVREAGGAYSNVHGLMMNGRTAAGIGIAERILADPNITAPVRFDAEASLILGHFLLGDEEAEKRSERILGERGVGQGDIAALMALTTLSNARWRVGELADGLSLGNTAVRYCGTVDPVWRLHFQLALAGKLANLREFDKADSLINDAEAGLHGLPTRVWAAAPAAMRARLALQAGRFRDARRQAELVTSAVERDAVPVLRPLAFTVLSTAALYTGDLPTAADYLKRAQSELAGDRAAFHSVQYAWTDVRVTAKGEGPRAAIEVLSDKYSHLPTERSLYIEDPGAAAFLVRLALDVGDISLTRSVLETVDRLARDNPGVPVIALSAVHANALVSGDQAALARIIAQSPDPISVALATGELAKLHSAKTSAKRWQTSPPASSDDVDTRQRDATCWSTLSDMERRIAYLVSVGLTNRQIAKKVYLSAHTVNYHLRKVFRKLGIKTRTELARGAAIYSSGAAVYSMGDQERQEAGTTGDNSP
ncbi:LuxR C-terminal-related transcriptional regulator [Streptomyces sp. NPDC050433]|uniref:helix-turn-helix transcriptional regulator n=1 Tax=Streptomyces sp. NPDC050433 TaxID=3365615 RepID=UPI0037B0BA15